LNKSKILIFLFLLPALIYADEPSDIKPAYKIKAQKDASLPTIRGAAPINSADLVVNIASVGRPTAGNLNPITNRREHTGTVPGAEDQVIYLSIPVTVVVTNVGRGLARPIMVDLEYENSGFPSHYAFFFYTPGSRLEGCAYFDEELAPGTSKTISGKIVAYPRILREYKQMRAGSSRFRFRVDPPEAGYPQGRIRELNEGNNYSPYTAYINFPDALPDLTVSIKSISPAAWPADGRRDYKVIPSITFEVRNIGDIDVLVGCPFKIEFDNPDSSMPWWIGLMGSVAGDIKVDEPRLLTFENLINIDDHSSRLKVTIDHEGIVAEKDENNNSIEAIIPEIRAVTPEVTTMH